MTESSSCYPFEMYPQFNLGPLSLYLFYFVRWKVEYLFQNILLWSLLHLRAQLLSCVWLFAAPWSVVHQVPLSRGFPKQEYWSELPFPPPGDLPNPGIEPLSLVSLHCNRILYQLRHLGSLNLGPINKVCLVLKSLGSNFYFFTILKHRRKQPWILLVFYK